jgi:hypothetical protein
MNHSIRITILLALLAVLLGSAKWDAVAGAYHVHLVPLDQKGFEVHVHDIAQHLPVDLTRGKVTATLLRDGKTAPVALAHHKQKGIMTSATPLAGKWTMLVRIDLQGQKPAQARFTSGETFNTKAKPKSQHDHAGHTHH